MRKRGWGVCPAVMAVGLALAVPALAAGEAGAPKGGNAVLMERWAEQRRLIRDEILATLRRQGRLPENGTVSFEALVAPDPKNRERLKVRLETIEISPAPVNPAPEAGQTARGVPPAPGGPARAGGTEMDRAFAPVDLSRQLELRNLDVPVDGTIRENVTIRKGRPVDPGLSR